MKLLQLRDLLSTAAERYEQKRDPVSLAIKLMEVVEAYKLSPNIAGTYSSEGDSNGQKEIRIVASFYQLPDESLTFSYSEKTGKFFYSYNKINSNLSRMKLITREMAISAVKEAIKPIVVRKANEREVKAEQKAEVKAEQKVEQKFEQKAEIQDDEIKVEKGHIVNPLETPLVRPRARNAPRRPEARRSEARNHKKH